MIDGPAQKQDYIARGLHQHHNTLRGFLQHYGGIYKYPFHVTRASHHHAIVLSGCSAAHFVFFGVAHAACVAATAATGIFNLSEQPPAQVLVSLVCVSVCLRVPHQTIRFACAARQQEALRSHQSYRSTPGSSRNGRGITWPRCARTLLQLHMRNTSRGVHVVRWQHRASQTQQRRCPARLAIIISRHHRHRRLLRRVCHLLRRLKPSRRHPHPH